MADEDLTPTPTQAESDEMLLAAVKTAALGEPQTRAREGEDLTPAMTQAQNDVAMLIATGPPPDSLPPFVVDVPYVGGTGAVGETLTCTMGNWTGAPGAYSYGWSPAGAADAAEYVVQAADAGTSITCTVTATNANGSTAAPPSNAVAVAAAAAASARHEPEPPAKPTRRS